MKKTIVNAIPITGLLLCLAGWGCDDPRSIKQHSINEIRLADDAPRQDSSLVQKDKKDSKEGLAIPIYSRSWPGKSGEAIAALSTKAGTNYTLERSTTDTPKQIIEFYQKLFPAAKVVQGETLWVISGKTPSGADFVVSSLHPKGQKHTSITISWTVLKRDRSSSAQQK